MVTVIIIGLLAALSIPAMRKAQRNFAASSLANNFRVYAAAFEVYATEYGQWPSDDSRGTIPTGLNDQLPWFTEQAYKDARCDWDYKVAGTTAAVSLHHNQMDPAIHSKIDAILDDSVLSTGLFRLNGGFVSFILVP